MMTLFSLVALVSCLCSVIESYEFEAESWLQLYDGLDDDFEEFWYSDDLWDTKTSLIASDGTQFEKQCNAFIQLCVCKDTSTGTMHECRETAASSAQSSNKDFGQSYSSRFNYFDDAYAYNEDDEDNDDDYYDDTLDEAQSLLDVDYIGDALARAYEEDYGIYESYSNANANELSKQFAALDDDYRDDAEYYYYKDYNDYNDYDYNDNNYFDDDAYDDMDAYLDAALGDELKRELDDYLQRDFAAYSDYDDYENYNDYNEYDDYEDNSYSDQFAVRQMDYYDDLFDKRMQQDDELQDLISDLQKKKSHLENLIHRMKEQDDELDQRIQDW